MSNPLFTPHKLADQTLKNRVVMAPLTRSRAIDNVPNDLMATYYGQRNGAGLIITEGTSPSPNGLGYPRIPGCFNQEQADGWAKVTEAVHADGGKIFLQMMHTGRVSHPDNLPIGARVLAPSSIELKDTKMYVDGKGELPIPVAEEMTIDDIQEAIEEYANCAHLAMQAGFDGVEIHSANGYLLEQFLSPITNHRNDQYGGNRENRLRFLQDVTEAVVARIGANNVGLRLSPYGTMNETGKFEDAAGTFTAVAELMNDIGIAYIHIADHEAMGSIHVPSEIKKNIYDAFGGTVILCGGFDADSAGAAIKEERAELVAFGRPFIANPDLVKRMKEGAELNDPNFDTFYTPGAEGYTDYPVLEAEKV